MAKRFTDKSKHRDPWYRKLPPAYKALWEYINDECDNAGAWLMDFETASYFVGEAVNGLDAKRHFEDRIVTAGSKWFVKDYVPRQYGKLRATSNIHTSVITLLKSHGIEVSENGLPIFESSEILKIDGMAIPSGWDKNKKENKDKKEEIIIPSEPDKKIIPLVVPDDPLSFQKFWDLYDYKKERDASEKIWNKLTRDEKQKIMDHVPAYVKSTPEKKYRKYPTTYLNKKSWNDEITQPNESHNNQTRSTAQVGTAKTAGKL